MWKANDKKPDELKIQELQERLERVERKLNQLTEVTKEPNGEERYLDVGNACRYLNCGRTLIYELMKSGHLAFPGGQAAPDSSLGPCQIRSIQLQIRLAIHPPLIIPSYQT